MRIYIFKSETRTELRAFAGDEVGSMLPKHHGPWTVTGIVGSGSPPPHKISRDAIEEAIELHGFQMWKLAKPAAATAD